MWQEAVEAGVGEALAAVLARRGLTTGEVPSVHRPPQERGGDWSSALARAAAAGDPRTGGADALAAELAAELLTRDWVVAARAEAGHVVLDLTDDALVADVLTRPGGPTGRAAPPPSDPLLDVRLAHARGRNAHRNATRHGVQPLPPHEAGAAVVGILHEPHVRALLLQAAASHAAVARARRTGRADPVVAHLRRTAAAFDSWYATTRLSPRGEGAITSAHRTRLCLNDVTTAVLARGLTAIGLDAPEHL